MYQFSFHISFSKLECNSLELLKIEEATYKHINKGEIFKFSHLQSIFTETLFIARALGWTQQGPLVTRQTHTLPLNTTWFSHFVHSSCLNTLKLFIGPSQLFLNEKCISFMMQNQGIGYIIQAINHKYLTYIQRRMWAYNVFVQTGCLPFSIPLLNADHWFTQTTRPL